jgi:hypothetical protein
MAGAAGELVDAGAVVAVVAPPGDAAGTVSDGAPTTDVGVEAEVESACSSLAHAASVRSGANTKSDRVEFRTLTVCRESGVAVVAHRSRDVSEGVKNSPDIHDVIADDVEHEIRESSQRADAEARNLEFVGESPAARLR